MALGDIKHNIEEQAKREAVGIREAASKEADAIIGGSKERAKGILQGVEKQIEEELKRMRDESEASAELAAKNVTLTAREGVLSDEAAKMRRLLVKDIRASKAYLKVFKDAMRQARDIAPAEELVITVDKSDRAKLGETASKVETKGMDGGLVISSRSGDIEINATVDRLIDSKSDAIRNALLDELFGSGKMAVGKAAKRPRKSAARKAAKAKKSRKSKK